MTGPDFEAYDSTADNQIDFINRLQMELRTRYEQTLRYLLHRLENVQELELSVPHGSGGQYTMIRITGIEYDGDKDQVFLKVEGGDIIPFFQIMTDVQDLIVSHIHIRYMTEQALGAQSENFIS